MNNRTPDYYDTLLVQRGADYAFRLAADDARKLREVNAELLEALIGMVDRYSGSHDEYPPPPRGHVNCPVCKARDVISRAKGERDDLP